MHILNLRIELTNNGDIVINGDLFTFDGSKMDDSEKIILAVTKYLGKNPDYMLNIKE